MKMKKLRSANSFDKPECAFEGDANDDFDTVETDCSHCLRKAQLAQLRALNGNESKIRMSGYLKKKRNSITGGWRKLYFVLRNRFLLSYRSRDIYEPVKDVIRLHKRMAILPRAGLRFEIMDNGYVLYSLRCESQQTFSEWITVLLNSFVNANGEANYEWKISQEMNPQWPTIVPEMSSEVCLAIATDEATAATDDGSREVRPVMPAPKTLETGHINVSKLPILSDGQTLNSNALPQPVEYGDQQEHKAKNENNDNKQMKITYQSGCGEVDHQGTEEVITQSFQFPDKSKLSSNISESSVPEQYIHIYSTVMGDQSFGTESGTLPMIMRQSTMRNIYQRISRSCSDLPTVHTAMYRMNTSLSKSSVKVAMHSYSTNVHEYVSLLSKPNNPSVAPPSPNITLRKNEIFQEMSPIYATIDLKAKKHRRAQLQQVASAPPTSTKLSNSDDELPLLRRAASERSRTVENTQRENEIFQEMPPIYATIDVRAKKHRRAQLQQLPSAPPTSTQLSNSDDELPLLRRAASERSRTVENTLRENEIFQEMPPIYATIDVRAKKHRRAQLQQLASALPTSIKLSNSDDELPLLSRAASERTRTVDDSGCNIYEEIEYILPAIIMNPKSSDSYVSVSDAPKNIYTGKTKNQNSGGSSSVDPPLYEDVVTSVAATNTKEELMIMRKNNNSGTENFYEEILFPPTASDETLCRTKSMLLPAGNKTAQNSTTKHGRSIAHTFWKMLKRVPFPKSSNRRKESTRDSRQQQSPQESIFLQGNGSTMDYYSRKGKKKSLRKRIMKSLMFDRYDYPNSSSSRSINNSLYNDKIIIQNVQNGIMTTEM